MKNFGNTLVAACASIGLACAAGGSALAQGGGHGNAGMSGMHKMADGVSITEAWARATPGLSKNGGAYVTIVNSGSKADRLVAASGTVARKVELHTHIMENGVMKMRRVEGIDVPAGKTVALHPGGYHIMLIGLHKPLKEGDRFPLTLTFRSGARETVTVEVKGIGAMGPGGASGGAGHSMGGMKMDGMKMDH